MPFAKSGPGAGTQRRTCGGCSLHMLARISSHPNALTEPTPHGFCHLTLRTRFHCICCGTMAGRLSRHRAVVFVLPHKWHQPGTFLTSACTARLSSHAGQRHHSHPFQWNIGAHHRPVVSAKACSEDDRRKCSRKRCSQSSWRRRQCTPQQQRQQRSRRCGARGWHAGRRRCHSGKDAAAA